MRNIKVLLEKLGIWLGLTIVAALSGFGGFATAD